MSRPAHLRGDQGRSVGATVGTVGPRADAARGPAHSLRAVEVVPERVRANRPAHLRRREPIAPGRARGRIFGFLRLGVTASALVYILHKSGLHRILSSLGNARSGLLALGFALGIVSALITALQWHGLLHANGLSRRYRRCLHLELAGRVFDAALPSSVGGDVVRAIYVADDPAQRVGGAASVVLRRLFNFPGLVVLMAIGLLASLGDPYLGRILPYALVALAGGALLGVVGVSPLFGRFAKLRVMQRGFGRSVGKLFDALHAFRGHHRQLVVASLRGVVFWAVVVVSQWAFMLAVGVRVPFAYAALVVTVTNAITLVPISIGGYGLRESAFATFLAVAHMATPAEGVAVGICLTAQTMGLGLIGVPFYLTIKQRRRRAEVTAVTVAAVTGA